MIELVTIVMMENLNPHSLEAYKIFDDKGKRKLKVNKLRNDFVSNKIVL